MSVADRLKKAVEQARARIDYLRRVEKRFGPPRPGRPPSLKRPKSA